MIPLWLLSLLSGAGNIWSSFWTAISKPPGLYIALAIALFLGVRWYGTHEYAAGEAANEARHAAINAAVGKKIEIANIGLAADVKASSDKALAGLVQATQHLSDLLTLQQSEISHAYADANIDARYPVPCVLVRAFDAGRWATAPSALAANGCASDGAAAPTRSSAVSAAVLNLWSWGWANRAVAEAAIADDEGVRKAYGDWREKVIAAQQSAGKN